MPDSVQKQMEDQLVAIAVSLQLEWPQPAEIRARRLPWDTLGDGTLVVHGGLTIYPLPTIEAAGTNQREDMGYGAGLAFIAAADHSTSMNRNRVHAAKEAVRRKIIHDRLTLVLDSGMYLQTKVSNGEVNVPKEGHQYEVSGLVVRCWVREPRT
jgi:hypothetical protein